MSDYSVTTDFSVKDALPTGNPSKLIVGAEFDVEFDAIAVAIATKYDSADLASLAQAQAGADNTVLMTPLRTENWADTWAAENAGAIADIQAIADPGADRVLFWDDSSNAVEWLTMGTNLSITGNTLDASGGGGESNDDIAKALLAAEDATSDTTYSIVTDLTISIPINETHTYHFWGELESSAGSGGYKMKITDTSTASARGYFRTTGDFTTGAGEGTWFSVTPTQWIQTASGGAIQGFFHIWGTAVGGASGGDIQVEFAQETSSGNKSTLGGSPHQGVIVTTQKVS